jgi:NAD(P)-dependent dehydrogenase (short-subunit alcohol dehydrogenase family)
MRTTTYSFLPPTSERSTPGSRLAVERAKIRAHAPREFRTAIITGGNSGLGYECARALLTDSSGGQPWHLILACRDLPRAHDAVERLRNAAAAAGSSGQVEAMRLNLASLQSVRDFASELARRLEDRNVPPVQALICNAGVQSGALQTFTVDGFESTFGVNHLGHFLLVNLLTPLLASPSRIAVVASGVHDPAQKTGIPAPAWNDPAALARGELGSVGASDSAAKAGRRRYSTSKLANVFFTYELARRVPAGITVSAFDPGLMPGTGLARAAAAPLRWFWHQVLPRVLPLLRRFVLANVHTPAESGAALARLVTDPTAADWSGNYFEGTREIRSSLESYDASRAAELWNASLELTGFQQPDHSTAAATAAA